MLHLSCLFTFTQLLGFLPNETTEWKDRSFKAAAPCSISLHSPLYLFLTALCLAPYKKLNSLQYVKAIFYITYKCFIISLYLCRILCYSKFLYAMQVKSGREFDPILPQNAQQNYHKKKLSRFFYLFSLLFLFCTSDIGS